jgi:hypothetical protein
VKVRAFGDDTSWAAAFGNSSATVMLGGGSGGVAQIGAHNSSLSAWNSLAINSGGGNVGIGVSNPNVKLHIEGGSVITLASGGHLQLGPTTGNNMVFDHNDIQRPNNGAAAELILNRYGGNVGIGLDNPLRPLHVNGNARVDGTLQVNGSSCCSDLRFKKKIIPLKDAMNILGRLRGVRYEWKTQEYPDRHFQEKPDIGFIAQEVATAVPEIVSSDEAGFLGIDYGRLAPVIVEAIKEQQGAIKAKDIEIQELKNRLANLESIVGKLVSNEDTHRSLTEPSTASIGIEQRSEDRP